MVLLSSLYLSNAIYVYFEDKLIYNFRKGDYSHSLRKNSLQ